VTGRAADGGSSWDGPAWAAPERAERLATRPEYGRRKSHMGGKVLGFYSRALVKGHLDAATFRDCIMFIQSIEKRIAQQERDA
jgi:hypothetical protein